MRALPVLSSSLPGILLQSTQGTSTPAPAVGRREEGEAGQSTAFEALTRRRTHCLSISCGPAWHHVLAGSYEGGREGSVPPAQPARLADVVSEKKTAHVWGGGLAAGSLGRPSGSTESVGEGWVCIGGTR